MPLFVNLGSAEMALQHLSGLASISNIAEIWSEGNRGQETWADHVDASCSLDLLSALRTTLTYLVEHSSRQVITSLELHELLENIASEVWQDALFCALNKGVTLRDAIGVCIGLRDSAIQTLDEADMLGPPEWSTLVLLFDWIIEKVQRTWPRGREFTRSGRKESTSFDINDMQALVESVHSKVDLNPVLQLIVDRVRESGIWPMCAIGIIDENDQEIEIPAQAGFKEDYPAGQKFPAGGSATLAAIRREAPIAISNALTNGEFPVLPEAAKAAGYRSILLIPIPVGELHAVVAFCSRNVHKFTAHDIATANSIGQQVAIAIENANRYEREKKRTEELESLNTLIADQNRLLQRSAEIHTALTCLVLDDAGMDRILMDIRKLLGNPVAIEDEYFQLLVYSDDWEHFDRHRRDSIAAGGTSPEVFSDPRTASVINDLRRSRRAILMPSLPSLGIEKRRLVAPIIAGGEILGYVWVMESLHPFDERDGTTIEQASLVLALEMMKQRASFETELRLRADFLDDLLSEGSGETSQLLRRAGYLGYNFNHHSVLLVIHIDWIDLADLSLPKEQRRNQRIILQIQDTVSRHSKENLVANQGGRVIILVPARTNTSDPREAVSKIESDLRREIRALDDAVEVTIGVGGIFQDLSEVPVVYRKASQAIDAAQSLNKNDETVTLDDLGIYGILFDQSQNDELLSFAHKTLAPIIQYDQQYNTELLKTLNVLLLHQMKRAKSARQLHIHVNTLRQRVNRIEEILGLGLDNPLHCLNLHLALRVHEIAPDGFLT